MPTPVPVNIFLETVVYNGPSKYKKNLLFLGDGFDANPGDRQLFDKTIDEILLRFFRRAPFNLPGVKTLFNVFKAYTPSPFSGISCLLDVDATGTTIDMDNVGIAGPPAGKLSELQSALGLTYGTSARIIQPKVGDENLILNFVSTLELIGETPADNAIPDCWAAPPASSSSFLGKDFGLVLVLVNDDKYAGSGLTGFVVLSLGRERSFNLTGTVAPGMFSHVPSSARNDYNLITTGVHHELAHGHFNLQDEYTQSHDPNLATKKGFFHESNVVTGADIKDGSGNIDPTLIKWYKEAFPGSAEKIISKPAFDYMKASKKPLWERSASTPCASVGVDITPKYPPKDLRNKIRYPQRIIGLYEGGAREACGVYSPSGSCRMRSREYDNDFCYVCKHSIIEQLDPQLLEKLYNAFYPRPEAK